MASIRKQGRRVEIRECHSTPRGPRQHMLASFHGVLSPEVLDRAAEEACTALDREAVMARAREMGIPVTRRRQHPEARSLLARLQRGVVPAPHLVALLRAQLADLPAQPVPEHLREAEPWLGQPESERGKALRGLLRTADRIIRSRGPLRTRPQETFPRFSSRPRDPVPTD